MKMGEIWGCHQMPERSFTIKGWQFPVCARCTGVLIGHTAGAITYFKGKRPFKSAFAGCCVMLADWLVQYLGIKESTNKRRLFTGILGGFGAGVIYFEIVSRVTKFLRQHRTTIVVQMRSQIFRQIV